MWDYPYVLPDLLAGLIFLACYLYMPHLINRRNRTFLRLFVLLTAALAFDIVGGWMCDHTPFRTAAVAVHWIYCSFFPLIAYFFLIFVMDVLRLTPEEAPHMTTAARVAVIAAEILTFSSVLTGSASGGEGDVVRHGVMHAALNACFILEAALLLRLIRKYSGRLNRYEYLSAEASQILLLCGNIAHIILPSHVVIGTTCIMATIILYLAFENPNLYMANRGNAFNIRAFREVLDEKINQKSYRILAFALRDYIDMRGIYGGMQMDLGVSLIGEFLVRTYTEYQVFYLRSGRFVVLGPGNMDWEELRAEIRERFQAPWTADNAELDLNVTFVQVEPETGLDSVDKILNYLFLAFNNADSTLSQPDGLIEADSIRLIDRQVEIKRSLDRCLENNEVEIFLQPLIESRSRTLAGAEVLCRIRDESGKIISPAVFIPIAEQNGRINLMGEQVLEKACQFVRDNDLNAIGLSWLNVNLSPIQCMKKDLSQRFSTILSQYGVSTDVIHLEITEQTVMDVSRLEQQIQILQGFGFRFSLDDYGSGYSNLSRVKQYPFANIKLDMSIVWDYIRDQDVLLPTIVRAFKKMGFSVTAEGIENAEMADAMSALGCDYLQGYYFSKPLPTDEFVTKYTLLRQSV